MAVPAEIEREFAEALEREARATQEALVDILRRKGPPPDEEPPDGQAAQPPA